VASAEADAAVTAAVAATTSTRGGGAHP